MDIDEAIETLKEMLKWEKECLHYDVSQFEIQAIETLINEYNNLKQIEEAHRIENGKLREEIKNKYYQLNDEMMKNHYFKFNRQKFFDKLPKEIFDINSHENLDFPNKLANFLNEIDLVCQKYGYSISHEDCHGGFIIEKYDDRNIKWLCDCYINIED